MQGDQNQVPSTPAPSATPPTGAWVYDYHDVWQWDPTATPDPTLVSQWGYQTITNVRQSPNGDPGPGSWVPEHGGGWQWVWGQTQLDPNLVNTYGANSLTDPTRLPGSNTTTDANQQPPADVNTPNLTDTWQNGAPVVTGDPTGTGGSGPQVTTPPVHSPYVVAPGDIRNAETVVLGSVDDALSEYNTLQSKVSTSKTPNVYTATASADLINTQDQALLQIGDVLEMTGQFVSTLNNAAQYYAKADIDSYLPQS
jgi:hypothetical protein